MATEEKRPLPLIVKRPKNIFNKCMNEMKNYTEDVTEDINLDAKAEINAYLKDFRERLLQFGDYSTVLKIWNEIQGDQHVVINLSPSPVNLVSTVKLTLPNGEEAITLPFSEKNSCFTHKFSSKNFDDIFSITFEVPIGRGTLSLALEVKSNENNSKTFPVSLPIGACEDYQIGDIVTMSKNRVGKICYIGPLKHKPGDEIYCGIDLLFGTGKGDGSRAGTKYFNSTRPDSGAFPKVEGIRCLGIDIDVPALSGHKRMKNVDFHNMHGLMAEEGWLPPIEVVTCEEENRPGYDSMPSHEYNDDPRTLKKKIKLFAQLVSVAEKCMAYTGAGISTSSGINDYASKAKNSKMKEAQRKKQTVKKKGRDCLPTLGHRVLVELYRHGWLKHWVQQNHDGLPQKAGYPHHEINEIHGGWFDISNPVVPMTGTLRDDCWDWMLEWQEKADLTITMGTSLCGMSADDCVRDVAERYKKDGVGLGAIIVGLQRTPLDEISSLRIYGTIDEVVALLAEELKINIPPYKTFVPAIPKNAIIRKDVYKVPYNKFGKLEKDPEKCIIWDLSRGAKVKCVSGPGKGFCGEMCGFYKKSNHYAIKTKKMREGHKDHGKKVATYYIGSWMVEAVIHGRMKALPVVNRGNSLKLQKSLGGEN